MEKKLLNISETSKKLGVSTDTLRNWDKTGKLKPIRTKGNHRRYKIEDITKILSLDIGIIDDDKLDKNDLRKDKIIVYTYVCGDILHRGHLLYLRNAALLGDFLIVGVLTDEAVMEKKKKPIICFEERIELVECLKMVDTAVPQSQYSPCLNIKNLKPDVLMESNSHDEKLIKESKKSMEELGGKVVISSYYPCQSSTEIKNKIKESK